MPVVLDASVAVANYYQDERTHDVADVFERVADEGALVPAIWPLEVANALLSGVRAGRTGLVNVRAYLSLLATLATPLAAEDVEIVLQIAHERHLTTYDAAYLHAAVAHGAPLATLDRRLAAAATAMDVEVLLGA